MISPCEQCTYAEPLWGLSSALQAGAEQLQDTSDKTWEMITIAAEWTNGHTAQDGYFPLSGCDAEAIKGSVIQKAAKVISITSAAAELAIGVLENAAEMACEDAVGFDPRYNCPRLVYILDMYPELKVTLLGLDNGSD